MNTENAMNNMADTVEQVFRVIQTFLKKNIQEWRNSTSYRLRVGSIPSGPFAIDFTKISRNFIPHLLIYTVTIKED